LKGAPRRVHTTGNSPDGRAGLPTIGPDRSTLPDVSDDQTHANASPAPPEGEGTDQQRRREGKEAEQQRKSESKAADQQRKSDSEAAEVRRRREHAAAEERRLGPGAG
jgi:hypothetical protein